jgi:hypothetical protein
MHLNTGFETTAHTPTSGAPDIRSACCKSIGSRLEKFLGDKVFRCYFTNIESNTDIPHRKRGMTFLIAAVVMLILGETVFRSSLSKVPFIIYWMACFVLTAMAVLFAFLDVAGVQRQAREQQRELLEKTIREIARQKEAKTGRSNPGANPQ